MITELIVTDITNMHADRICVAGVNHQKCSIRPLFSNRHLFREWCFQQGQIIQPFSIIRLDLLEHTPKPPHTEDWIMDDNFLQIVGIMDKNKRQQFLETTLNPNVEAIFGAPIHSIEKEGTFLTQGQGFWSLGTIKPKGVFDFFHACYDGHWDYRVSLSDQTGEFYRLKIVDLTFQTYVDFLRNRNSEYGNVKDEINQMLTDREVYLRVGLARNWGKFPDRCYLQITGIYTFPDYLEGRCFADFNMRGD